MTRRSHSLFAVLVMCLALAAPAQGQDPRVDPDSPAGTEYELPLDRAREEAGASGVAGGSSSSGGGTGEAPLFGEGVEATSQTAKSQAGRGTDSDPSTVAGVEPDDAAGTPETVRAQAAAPDGGGGGLVAVGAGAGGVLLLGGLAGLLWRRRSSPG